MTSVLRSFLFMICLFSCFGFSFSNQNKKIITNESTEGIWYNVETKEKALNIKGNQGTVFYKGLHIENGSVLDDISLRASNTKLLGFTHVFVYGIGKSVNKYFFEGELSDTGNLILTFKDNTSITLTRNI